MHYSLKILHQEHNIFFKYRQNMLDTITFCSVLQKSDFYSTNHLSGYKVWQHTECLKMKNSTYVLVYEFYTKIWVCIFLLHRIEQLWNDESKKKIEPVNVEDVIFGPLHWNKIVLDKYLAFLIFFTFLVFCLVWMPSPA